MDNIMNNSHQLLNMQYDMPNMHQTMQPNMQQSGTSIAQLKKLQQPQQLSQSQQIAQVAPVYNDTPILTRQAPLEDLTIDNLVSDIHTSFDDYSPSDENEDYIHEKPKKKSDSNYNLNSITINKILVFIREPLLLLIIYVLLSLEPVVTFFGKYLTIINQKDDGSISIIGIILYGIIFTILFLTLRKLLLGK